MRSVLLLQPGSVVFFLCSSQSQMYFEPDTALVIGEMYQVLRNHGNWCLAEEPTATAHDTAPAALFLRLPLPCDCNW